MAIYRPLCLLMTIAACMLHVGASVVPRNGNCNAKADILFVLDGSGSIKSSNFAKLKTFVAEITENFKVGPNAIQFGVLVFSNNVDYRLRFSSSQTNANVASAIRSLSYPRGGTKTFEALSYARETCFTAAGGHRHGVPKIAVVMTDGRSNNFGLTTREAEALKDSGVTSLAVGIGSNLNQDELSAIATSSDMKFTVQSFQVLDTIRDKLLTWTCPKPCSVNASLCAGSPNQVCVDKADNAYECQCKPGFVRNRGICSDPDQCALDRTLCHDKPNQVCVNTDTGYNCECSPGNVRDHTGDCADPDQCALDHTLCHDKPHQVCVNTDNGYHCDCSPGNVRDHAGICGDPDQCALDKSLCHDRPHQMCIDTDTGYRCECTPGNVRDPHTAICGDPDQCAMEPTLCHDKPHQVCVNTDTGFHCACSPGMVRDHTGDCGDPDQCALDPTLCTDEQHQVCVNTDNGYLCQCQHDYTRDSDGYCQPNVVCCHGLDDEEFCKHKVDGDYAACKPDCAKGTYYSCVAGRILYVRTCALGNYWVAGTRERMNFPTVFDPDTRRCEHNSTHCPRPNLSLPIS